MRIAYVYDAVYPDVTGGVERRIWEISRRLADRGHDVHIFGMHLWEGNSVITREGVTLHGICRPLSLYHRGKRRIFPPIIFGFHIFLALIRERFDIIDCQQFPYFPALTSIASSRITASPIIITWHEVWDDYWYDYLGLYGAAGKFMERILALCSFNVIVVSETTGSNIRKLIPGRRIELIPNGIDMDEIGSISPSLMKSDIVFVGRLIKEKHVDVLVHTVSILKDRYPDIRCVTIGDGPERRNLELMTRSLGLSDTIIFTGLIRDSSDVIGYLKSSRVFVFPSTREGFGMAALEALACGLPVVTVNHLSNAAQYLVTEGCGAVCSLDPTELSMNIQNILENQMKNDDLCHQRAREFEWDRIVDKIERYYNEVRGK